tara:strand:+ start:1494 stop:1940 length:447 start_codon:yes stop_codon:yes gene_type:complete
MEDKIRDLLDTIDEHKEEFTSDLYNKLALSIADIHASVNDDQYVIIWGIVVPKKIATDDGDQLTGFFCKTLLLCPAVDVTELDHDFNVITGQEYKGVDTMCLLTIASIGMGINIDLFNEIKSNVDDVRCGYKYISDDNQVIINKYMYS